jgi:hypothetical protein
MSLLIYILIPQVTQKRLVLEHCIYKQITQMIQDIDTYAASGAWQKVSESKLLLQIFKRYEDMFYKGDGATKFDLFSFLFLNLYENIRKIDNQLLIE